MSAAVSNAMLLAAGQGIRMRPLTLARPKPLIEVAGKALIDYAFDRLRQAGVSHAVVNVHYLAEQIEAWAKRRTGMTIAISDERTELLDTGGGITLALPHLGDAPFFVLNSDSFWIDGARSALKRLQDRWDDAAMDCLLLLCPLPKAVGYDGEGDFVLDRQDRATRRKDAAGEALVYAGGYLVHPRLFRESPGGKFSMNVLWDKAIAQGRLFGLVHEGLWFHVGTPESIALAEAALREA
jgi:MurNAc alpha-1-phosphate uridylyltransferase